MRKEQFVSERRERDFTGVFIPSKLYLTNKFSPREKFLLVEIHSLRKRDKSGDCFASNRHFADFIGVSERTIQSMLNGLKQNGYITSWYEYEKDNYLKKFSKKEIKLINQLNYKKEFKLSSKDIDLLFKNHNNKRYIKEESICDISDKELQSLIQNIKQRVRSI